MSTPVGSAGGSGRATKLPAKADVRSLSERLGIGTEAELREDVDYSQQMEIVLESVPDDVVVRWVGINNSRQIELHLLNGYTYVTVHDEIATKSGVHTTDASGQYMCVGDCVLMACSKEAYNRRRKKVDRTTETRLKSAVNADEFKAQLEKTGNQRYLIDDSRTEVKSTLD
jgi:hypothetical protein